MRSSAILHSDAKNQASLKSSFGRRKVNEVYSLDASLYSSSQGVSHSFGKINVHGDYQPSARPVRVQPKLEVNQPDDKYEKEADAVADKVMRMPAPSFISSKYSGGNEQIQREEDKKDEKVEKDKLQQQPTEPDFLSLRTPFFERNVPHLWDPQSALGVWKYNLDFFKRFGLDTNLAGKAANLTTPLFINSQLKADNPNWWEITDRELNTSSIVGTLPLFKFDSDFKNWKLLPSLQKKPLDNSELPISHSVEENRIYKKCAHCEEKEVSSKPLISYVQRKVNLGENVTSEAVNRQIQTTQGGGNPLPQTTKSFMESRFGTDFSRVKIHTDNHAAQLSRQLNAQAFTVGSDIYFNQGKFSPESSQGKQLLAHELTHTIQQSGVSETGPSLMIQRQEDARVQALKEKVRQGGKLTDEDIAYLKEHIGKEVVQQILGGAGQITINFSSSRKPEDINRRFQARLELRLSGVVGAVAKSLEGIATADVDLVATLATEKAVITVGPPTESNRMAAMIRQQIFPNGSSRSFDVPFPKEYFKYANAVSLKSGITVSLVGPGTQRSGAMIEISHASIDKGIELIMTLAPSARSTSIEDTKRDLPSDHWKLTPKPRIFGTLGYGGSGKSALTGTLGADVPLAYDTTNPLLYPGLGVRGSVDTNQSGRVGGTAFAGINLDPLSLQLGVGTGVAFLREPIITADGPAQTVLYHEVEGSVTYKVLPNIELMLLLSVGSGSDGKKLPAYGTGQFGVGFRFK